MPGASVSVRATNGPNWCAVTDSKRILENLEVIAPFEGTQPREENAAAIVFGQDGRAHVAHEVPTHRRLLSNRVQIISRAHLVQSYHERVEPWGDIVEVPRTQVSIRPDLSGKSNPGDAA